jgi:fatty-acyl-CoA synthase
MTTMAEFVRRNDSSHRPALLFEDESWTHAEVVRMAAQRSALLLDQRGPGPLHVGVLLENVPEALFWMEAAMLAGAAVAGINPTRRGAELARDIQHIDCQFIVTDSAGTELLEGLDLEQPILVTGTDDYARVLNDYDGTGLPDVEVDEKALLFLIFTSGTTAAPKAAICSQGRLARLAERSVGALGIMEDDVAYNAMPWFHSNALYVAIATSIVSGGTLAMRRRFSASGWLGDVQRFRATYFNYVGKPIEYILATEATPHDRDHALRFAVGNEANEADIAEFERRFGVKLSDGFGSTEMGVTIIRTPEMPAGALGRAPDDNTVVIDPATGKECPRAQVTDAGLVTNLDEAIGEIVNKAGLSNFEGYYNNDEANRERSRNGWYWSGDLAYRDVDGYFYFAGRGYDWIRVDGENFAAAPVERILLRHPDVMLAAVYAVPDPHVGDRVMAALELRAGRSFDPGSFAAFLGAQPDLGTKWWPDFVRVVDSMPATVTNKILKRELRAARWVTKDPVWWRPERRVPYRPFTDMDAADLKTRFEQSNRADALNAS